jgi:hypothetical protein
MQKHGAGQSKISVTASVFCITSVIPFHAGHVFLTGMFPCSCGRAEIREMPP